MNSDDYLSEYKFGEAFYGQVPKNKAREMAELWGEGSNNLTKLIEFCINHDIYTFASCKHQGYIGFRDMPPDFYAYLTNYMIQYTLASDKYCITLDNNFFESLEPRCWIEVSGVRRKEKLFETILMGVEAYTKEKSTKNIPSNILEKTKNYCGKFKDPPLILRNTAYTDKPNYMSPNDVVKERFSASAIGRATINISTKLKDACLTRLKALQRNTDKGEK